MAISEGEKQLLNQLDKTYLEGARYREEWSREWKHSIDVMRGRIWPERRPKYKLDAVMNFLGQVVEKKSALLTDARPTINVVSRKRGLDRVCEILEKTIEGILEERNFEQRLTEFVMLEQHFGIAYFNTCWDKSLDWGNGDIDLVVLDPRCCVFDPFVSRTYNLNSGEYFALETTRPTDYLRDIYHSRADDIKDDFTSGASLREDSVLARIREFISRSLTGQRGESGKAMSSVVARSIVRDFWLRDRKTKRDDKLAYPNWRHTIVAGGCIVEDGVNPYIDGNLSVDGMEWDFNVDSAYGYNEVAKLEMPQTMFNKVLATVIENAILMGNNIWIGDKDALSEKEWERLSNEPGSIVKVRPGRNLRREPAAPLPAYLTNVLTLLINGLEKLSSITEAVEGRRPGQVTSGVAIEALQIAAATAIRLKARQIEALIQRLGQKLISRIFQFYTNERIFNLLGKRGGFEQFVYERETIRKMIKENGGDFDTAFQDFQFKVQPASSLAMTKWQKGMMAMQLHSAGIIDGQEVLDAIEWPNREEILGRILQKQQTGIDVAKGGQQKLPKSVLRGGHRETGFQEFQQAGGK